jgi:uncharacterized protein
VKRKLYRWLKILLVIYILAGVGFYFFQEKFLFHPQALPAQYQYQFATPFKEINLAFNKETNFNIIQFLPNQNLVAKGVVLYFHGNRENINRYQPFASNFTKHGYEVWMCDYPGFGKSTGVLSENILYQESEQLYQLARQKFGTDSILIYGKSLGTGIAAYLASKQPCKRLLLETPYYNIATLANHFFWMYPTKYMLHYKICSNEYIQQTKAPITIFHGTNDGVVTYNNALLLAKLFKQSDELITIPNGEHNNLNDFPLFHTKIDSLLR